MPHCTVCTHPEAEAIDLALVDGKSFRSVALRFGVTSSSLFRHKRDHLSASLVASRQVGDAARTARLAGRIHDQEEAAVDHAGAILSELDRTLARVRKLFDACDRWLADPDDPSRYDLAPRAEEILVHYTVPGATVLGAGGAPTRAKAPLSALLAQAGLCRSGPSGSPEPGSASGLPAIDRLELRSADPRELILKTARRLEAELQLVARLLGLIAELAPPAAASQTTINMLVASPEWAATRGAILDALEPYPDAHRAVAAAMRLAACDALSPPGAVPRDVLSLPDRAARPVG